MREYFTKKILGLFICTLMIFTALSGCGEGKENVKKEAALADEVKASLDELNSFQLNFSQGVSSLVEIPEETVKKVYDSWDDVSESGYENAPILLREYVEPSIVYFDYATDCSIVWNKEENTVSIEQTDVDAREDYRQKEHK